MFKAFTAILTLTFVTTIVTFATMTIEPTGFKVSCDTVEFTMPAGTKVNAETAAKSYIGCSITKMQIKG